MISLRFDLKLGLALITSALLCASHTISFELSVVRDSTTKSCQFVSIQETRQVHKGLHASGDGYFSQTTKYSSGSPEGGEIERLNVFSHDETILRQHAHSLCGEDEDAWTFSVHDPLRAQRLSQETQHVMSEPSPSFEIHSLVESGSSSNRIDLVFFADGYTSQEKPKFLADATRLANDISTNQTFYTVKPLLNIWAAFSPSVDSGIGVGGKPKDTTFGLYRDGTELRGVYYDNPDAARLACASLGDQCDYPILMGNDPFYGGLGGEFTVITPSILNGALVLRHELGHSIINVGEEYDGGFAYFGCNAAQTPEEVGWTHWLTEPSDPRVERMTMSLQAYPWTILDDTWSTKFTSPGTYAANFIRFSISGIPKSDQLTVSLDGKDLGWEVQKDVGIDRYFYEFLTPEALSSGEHEIEFTLNYPADDNEGNGPQLCSVEVLEYGAAHEFNSSSGYYGVFPTFSETNETTYRPTNEDCLMRQVINTNFCKVCIEGLWLALMSRVNIIEKTNGTCLQNPNGEWERVFEVDLLPLAQFRSNDTLVDKDESYEIIWSRTRGAASSGSLQDAGWTSRQGAVASVLGGEKEVFHRATNSTKLVLNEVADDVQMGDLISVDVLFSTEEVRVDLDGYLSGGGDWVIRKRCKH